MGVVQKSSQEVLCNLENYLSLTFNMFSVVLLSLVGMSSAQYFYRPTGYSHASFASPSHSYSWGVGNSYASVSRKYSPRVVAPAIPAFTRTPPLLMWMSLPPVLRPPSHTLERPLVWTPAESLPRVTSRPLRMEAVLKKLWPLPGLSTVSTSSPKEKEQRGS